jgi:hypothetical protein
MMFFKKKYDVPLCRCAFCHGLADIQRVGDAKQYLVYKCSNCGETPVRFHEARNTEQEARKIWNERTKEAEYVLSVYAHSKSTIFTRKDTARRNAT